MDFSLQLLLEQPPAELIDVVRLADPLGFRGCYSADETYHKDMWILFGAAAIVTRRIRFGPEVSGVILRDPTLIAQRTFLEEGRVDYRGEFYRYSGLFTAARPVQSRLPQKIGAMTGPRSFRLAGEIASAGVRSSERSRRSRTSRPPAGQEL